MSRLILASASPRRRQLLDSLGLRFEVRPVDIDESPLAGEAPLDLVRRLARQKAGALAAQELATAASPSEQRDSVVVLAADTIVVLGEKILGKPADPQEARAMLSELQGREHTVLTGVALIDLRRAEERVDVARTEVRISALDERRIAWYVDTGEPRDKAGAYAIQGLGALLVESIQGNYTNVVGLPLPTVRALLAELGYDLMEFGAA